MTETPKNPSPRKRSTSKPKAGTSKPKASTGASPASSASKPADQTASPESPPTAPAAYAPPAGQYAAPGVQVMTESDARTWAMLVHIIAAVAALLSAGTLSFIAPLVIWLIYRERSALVDWHGKQNLNLQITTLVVVVAGTILGFVTLLFGFIITLPLMAAYLIYAVIISFVAGAKASSGEYYSIPLVLPFLR